MKTGKNIQELVTELQRQQSEKRDYISPADALQLQDDGRTLTMRNMDFQATSLFHRQMGDALGIPAKYYDKMQQAKPSLLAKNVNSWLSDKDQSYMVRTLSGMARALLSDRYRRIDNLEVASAVLPIFAGQQDMEVVSSDVTEQKMYIKIVSKRIEAKCVGDVVQAGVAISNSEVGMGAVSVLPLVYTLKCSNGMIVNSLAERKTHLGRAVKGLEDFGIISDEAAEAEDRAFLLKLRDIVHNAFDEVRFAEIVATMEKSAEAKITGKVTDVVELTARTYSLNDGEREGILKYLIEGGDLSRYGLGNAITRTSQDIGSYDRATQLEGIGWNVVNMPENQWRVINAADI